MSAVSLDSEPWESAKKVSHYAEDCGQWQLPFSLTGKDAKDEGKWDLMWIHLVSRHARFEPCMQNEGRGIILPRLATSKVAKNLAHTRRPAHQTITEVNTQKEQNSALRISKRIIQAPTAAGISLQTDRQQLPCEATLRSSLRHTTTAFKAKWKHPKELMHR